MSKFCKTWVRKWEKVAYFDTSDFKRLFQGEIDPLARIVNSYCTAVKNDVRCVNKEAIAVF